MSWLFEFHNDNKLVGLAKAGTWTLLKIVVDSGTKISPVFWSYEVEIHIPGGCEHLKKGGEINFWRNPFRKWEEGVWHVGKWSWIQVVLGRLLDKCGIYDLCFFFYWWSDCSLISDLILSMYFITYFECVIVIYAIREIRSYQLRRSLCSRVLES